MHKQHTTQSNYNHQHLMTNVIQQSMQELRFADTITYVRTSNRMGKRAYGRIVKNIAFFEKVLRSKHFQHIVWSSLAFWK